MPRMTHAEMAGIAQVLILTATIPAIAMLRIHLVRIPAIVHNRKEAKI